MQAQQPSSSSCQPTNLNEHRYMAWGQQNKQCYDAYGDKNYPYGLLCDYSATWARDNLFLRQTPNSEENRPFRKRGTKEIKFQEIRMVL